MITLFLSQGDFCATAFGEPSMACTTRCHGMEGAEGADAMLHALSLTLWALSASLDPP